MLAAGAQRDGTRAPEKQERQAHAGLFILAANLLSVEPYDEVVRSHPGVRAETYLQVPIWP